MSSQSVARSPLLEGTGGEMIGEFFGTMVLILFGDGVVATAFLFEPFTTEWVVVMLGWGLAVMLGIYVCGAISGAHLNPAVTLGLAVRGKLAWNKVLAYWLAQVLGAFVAALILYFVYQGAIQHAISLATGSKNVADVAGGVFYTSPKSFVGTFGAFMD